jgi:hypothetical protein
VDAIEVGRVSCRHVKVLRTSTQVTLDAAVVELDGLAARLSEHDEESPEDDHDADKFLLLSVNRITDVDKECEVENVVELHNVIVLTAKERAARGINDLMRLYAEQQDQRRHSPLLWL